MLGEEKNLFDAGVVACLLSLKEQECPKCPNGFLAGSWMPGSSTFLLLSIFTITFLKNVSLVHPRKNDFTYA